MLLTNGFDPDIRVNKEACSLARMGNEVEIWCWDRESKYRINPKTHENGFSVRRFFIPSVYGSGLRQVGGLLLFYRSVLRHVPKGQFDAVHAHDFDTLFLGVRLSRKNHIPLTYDQHDLFHLYFKNRGGVGKIIAWIIQKAERVLLRYVCTHIVVTQGMKSIYSRFEPASRIHIIDNAPSKYLFPVREKPLHQPPRVSYIGSVNYFAALDPACRAAASRPESVILSIHGRGIDYERLKSQYSDAPNIKITGQFAYSSLVSLYNETDVVFAFYPTQISELSMPNKFYESLLSCTPMIVNGESEFGKIVKEHGWGFVFEESDLEESLRSFFQRLPSLGRELGAIRDRMMRDRETYSWERNEIELKLIYTHGNSHPAGGL
jgi:glycosyltransferase involved in cell wall biosynthesis